MNISILSLSIIGQYRSSFYTKPSHTGSSTSEFQKISISKSFSPFFYSQPSNSHINFKNSQFSKFLSNAVIVDKMQIIKTRELVSFVQDANFDFVKFTDINTLDAQGGGLCAFSSLNLTGTIFNNCKAQKGGAMAAYSDLSLRYVTITSCSSQYGAGGVLHNSGIGKFLLNSSLFIKLESKYYGSIYTKSNGDKIFHNSNISNSYATDCVGAMELCDGAFEFRYLNIHKSKANAHNGAFCLRNPKDLKGYYSVFMESYHGSEYSTTGASLLVYSSPYEGQFYQTFFINNKMENSYDICIDSGSDLYFIECQFTFPRDKEFSPSNTKAQDQNCSFGVADIIVPEEFLNKNAGITQKPIYQEPEHVELAPTHTHLINVFIAAAIAAVSSLLITFIQRKGFKALKCTKSQREVI